MSIKLRELIRNVRACKTAADERAVIAKECALIRTSFKEKGDAGVRHRNVAKLLYIHMLGYPTHFGQMESLKLIASPRFPEKRIGYLGLMILLDEKQEVLMLVTNSVKNDLHHENPYVVGLALCALGNVASVDIARDLASEVEKLFKNSNPYIKKKAALCACRVIRKVPDLVEDFVNGALTLLSDKNHAVLLTAVILMLEMMRLNPKLVKQFRKAVPVLSKILKTLVLAGYVSEYEVSGITDPFLQIRLLHVLRILGAGNTEASEQMADILAQVAINTDATKNPGNAILYEAVQTIMAIEAEGGLRTLGINLLGRFLSKPDNNIRYVALNTLCKAVGKDTTTIARHRNTIVDCLKDPDISIRRRALDLIYALVTPQNVRALVGELLNYLAMAQGDLEFKTDLTEKICVVVERFSPSKRWHIDTMIQVLAVAGSLAKEEIQSDLITLISRAKSLQPYAVHKLYQTLTEGKSKEIPLINVGVYCIGEYGEHLVTKTGLDEANAVNKGKAFTMADEKQALEMLESYIRNLESTDITRAYLLNCFAKLSTRFVKSNEQLKALVNEFRTSIALELQQRACEYYQLLSQKSDSVRKGVTLAMPAIVKKKKGDKDKDKEKASKDDDDDEDEQSEDTNDEEEPEDEAEEETAPARSNGAASSPPADKPSAPVQAKASAPAPAPKPQPQPNILDGLDFLSGPTTSSSTPAAAPSSGGLDILNDIFTSGSAPSTAQPGKSSNPVDDLLRAFGGGGPAPAPAPVPLMPMVAPVMPMMPMMPPVVAVPSAGPSEPQQYPSQTVFNKDGLSVVFYFKKPSPNGSKTQIKACFQNSTGSAMDKFDFQVAVPKYIKLRMKPASTKLIAPGSGANGMVQMFELDNTLPNEKKLMLRVKIDYEKDGQAFSEKLEIKDFPAGIN